ncbi:MAG: hypothetical protein NPINA01_30710 [Nitrospinaceae bacterium]|nr:MAG: hypothetical protein NPINA01_30710 [Nitrospinaceae bacterium]
MNLNRLAIPLLCGVTTAFLGAIVLVGWNLNVPALVQVHPSFAPMQFNTALGFLLCGLGLYFLSFGKFGLSKVLGSLAVLMGALTLIEYGFEIDLGIDQIFMDHHITTKTSHPGRMAPITSLCFFLTGLILLSLASPVKATKKMVFAAISTMIILVVSSSAFLGYMVRLETTYSWGNLTRMALHTSVGFIFLASGFTFRIWQLGEKVFRKFRLFPPLLASSAVFLLAISISAAQYLKGQQNIKQKIQVKAENIKTTLKGPVKLQTNALIRMAKRFDGHGDTLQTVWEEDAKNYLDGFNNLLDIKFVGPDYLDRWVVSPEKRLPEVNFNSSNEQINLKEYEKSRETKNVWFTKSFDIAQGVRGTQAIIPVFSKDKFLGLIVASFNINHLLNDILEGQHIQEFSLKIYENDKEIFKLGAPSEQLQDRWDHLEEVKIFNIHWLLHLRPTQEWVSKEKSYFALVLLFAGLFIGCLFGSTIYFFQRAEIEAEKNLAASKTRKKAIVNNVIDGIITLDERGIIDSFNPAAERLFGYVPSEVIGRNVKLLMPEPYSSEHDQYLKNYIETGVTKIIGIGREVVGLRKDGSTFPLDLGISEMYLGEIRMFTGIVRDITERKKSEREMGEYTQSLKKANEKLYTSNKELDDFAYIVSHDLKEPLRGIYNYATFIKEDYENKLDDEGHEKLDTLVRLSQRMETLINSILQYARLGRNELMVKAVDLNKSLDETLENLEVTLKEFHVEVRIPEPLPNIVCDETLVKEVFQNLIANAIKYNDKAEKWVEIGSNTIECSSNGNGKPTDKMTSYVLYVKDNGIGIHEKYFDSLFRIFKRLNGRKKFGDGTGAGTTIVKKIIEKHNGKIWLESTLGKGTTFYFTLEKTEHEQHQIQ